MRTRSNGSTQSNAVPTKSNTTIRYDYGIYRCVVVQTRYVGADNPTKNSKAKRVLYDLLILGGKREGQLLTNVRKASELGGNTNYAETVLTASTKPIGTALSEHDGDIVLVQFLQGDYRYPIITHADNGLDTADEIGATEDDGVRSKRKFNGITTTIDADGILTLAFDSGMSITCYPESNKVVVDADTIELAGNGDKVAMASKVEAQLNLVKTALSTVSAGGGVLTGVNSYTVVGSVGSEKVKLD